MKPTASSLLLVVIISFGGSPIHGGDVFLACDEFNAYEIETFCTVSGFFANHDDAVKYEEERSNLYFGMEVLKFTDSSMPSIPEYIFREMPNLREFDVSFTGLEMLHKIDFIAANHLLFFTSMNNKLSQLVPAVFQNAPNVSVIDLSHNAIEELKANTFAGAERVSRLYFSHNRIKRVHKNAFTTLFQLDTIQLDHNELESIDPSLFADCGVLQTIHLNDNRIVAIDCKTFATLGYLVKLELSANRLKAFNASCLTQTRLDYHIAQNNISRLDLFDTNTFDAASNGINELVVPGDVIFTMRELKLDGNSIANLSAVFSHFGALEHLDLSHNRVGRLNITTFKNLRNLKTLYLRNCSLDHITFGTFSSQKDLVRLDISYNDLKQINFDVFVPYLKHITHLYIDGNNLTEISGLSSEMFPELKTLGLSNNRFQCSEIIKTIMRFDLNKIELTVDSNETTSDMTHVSGIVCGHNSSADWSQFNIRYVNDHYSDRNQSQLINHTMIMQILDWQKRYSTLSFQEHTHMFYLNFIKYFIASIALVCLSIVAYKFAVFYQKQKRSHIILHEGFYRSAATLNSNHTDIAE